MLGWSLNLFRVRGIGLSVHFSFFLLLALNALEGWAAGGATGLAWNTAVLVLFFACVVLHELGHSFTAMRFGIGVRRILLLPIGGMAEFESIPREPRRELWITLAGPAVNFALAAALWFFLPRADSVPPYSAGSLVLQLFWANLIMGCFNFLPAFPMDGGRVLRALLATRTSYLRATWLAARVGKVVCALGAIVALYIDLPLLVVLFAFIFFVGEMEYRATRQRELEDAHWRSVFARVYPVAPPAEEPPVLTR